MSCVYLLPHLQAIQVYIRFQLSKHLLIDTQTCYLYLQLFFSIITVDPTHPKSKHTLTRSEQKKLIIPIWNKSVQPRGSHPKPNTLRLCFLSGLSPHCSPHSLFSISVEIGFVVLLLFELLE